VLAGQSFFLPAGAAWVDQPVPGPAMVRWPGGPVRLWQLAQPGRPALNVSAPWQPDEPGYLTVTRAADGSYGLEVHLRNPAAEALLGYYRAGQLGQAGAMLAGNRPALIAEDLLYGKFEDPIAAAVGAYVLLRLGETARLHEWTKNLLNFFSWLPDGLPIRAEHLARRGAHTEALALLRRLPERGLPIFSDGLSYAIGRLQQYLAAARSQPPAGRRPADEEALLARLRLFAAFAELDEPLLVFSGRDPARPDAELVSAGDLAAIGGLDLSQYPIT
jgi:hypothetical protein